MKCSKCEEEKHNEDFHKGRSMCKNCFNEATRNAKYLARYGITTEEADELKKKPCEICGAARNLHIDHNHNTGEIRGILCSSCNRGIGYLGDNPNRLLKAREYLEKAGHYG